MVKHTRDSTKHEHIHTKDGDIIYLKDRYSLMGKKVLTKKQFEDKQKLGDSE